MKTKILATAILGIILFGGAAQARDQIRVVGSSTVYPFVTAAAEKFGKAGKFKTPIVESTGTGGGFKLFCAGMGDDTADIANASRQIKDEERRICKKNGVTQISEVKIGYDGIILANSKAAAKFDLSVADIFLALARQVPGADGKLVANPNKTWDQVNKKLPKQKIEVYGPPPTSGTRDSFAEMIMENGCTHWEAAKATYADGDARKKACRAIREDGAYIESGENDNLIVQKLKANKNALGIFGYSFLEENKSIVQASKIAGKLPTHATIADGSYVISRALYVYVKRAHIGKVPGIKEFLTELTATKAVGALGYLEGRGLIPLPDAQLKAVQKDVTEGKLLNNLAEERVDVELLKHLAGQSL